MVTKRLVCRLRSSTWCRRRCSLRCCPRSSLLGSCRFTTLCLHQRLYKLHIQQICEEITRVQDLEILTAFSLPSLCLLYHGVSPVMLALHPLALCPSLRHFPHLIPLFILETLEGFFGSSGSFFLCFGNLSGGLYRNRLVSLNPLKLAKHWLYYLFVSFNICLSQVTRMHIVLHFL